MNLIEGLNQELVRNREILQIYEEIPQGAFGAAMIRKAIKEAEASLGTGDIVEMLRCFQELKETK